MNNVEIWKNIDGFNGLYQISSFGRIKSFRKSKAIIMKPNNVRGYELKALGLNKKKKHYMVHRLVAQAFIPNYGNKPEVNHVNGIKDDNRVENLEWCTRKENVSHAWKNGLARVPLGEKQHSSKLTKKQVLLIREKYKPYEFGYKKLSNIFNVTKETIRSIIKREIWKHI